MGEVRIPYRSVATYFGYLDASAPADDVREGRKLYHIYLWIPVIAPEIGVRMLSPEIDRPEPAEKSFIDDTFARRSVDERERHFDPWLRLERCLTATIPEDIRRPCTEWVGLGENDDSAELPEQPNGGRTNSLLRVACSADDSLKTLVRGLYRVAFTSTKDKSPQGSFIMQVGAPIDLPGVAIGRTPAELHRFVTKPSAP